MGFKLESDRIIIRPFREEDIAVFIAIHRKPEVSAYLPKRSDNEHRNFLLEAISRNEEAMNRWVIEDKSTGVFIGSCLLREFDAGNAEVIEIGYSFDSLYWGKGYASEMAALLKNYAATLPDIKKLVAVTEPRNIGSKAVLLKAGMKAKGTIVRYQESLQLDYFEYSYPREFDIKIITKEEVWPLRHKVMYPDLPFNSIKLDEDTNGIHLGLYDEGELRSVVSLFANGNSLQFRKFATDNIYQGKGYGSALLGYIVAYATTNGYNRIWCNARVSASGFYGKAGFLPTDTTYTQYGINFIIMERLL